ncbi:MAG: hypothetical protein IJC83_00105 [Oscillospiraceae bacterium]|nr:hypothetical protein [Oscillospiraceae bacterium]
MKIRFYSDLIKISFTNNESYCGKTVRMLGEALDDGFDAALSTAEWELENKRVALSDLERDVVRKTIEDCNCNSDFKILFMDE